MVLATIDGLQRVEQGLLRERGWRVRSALLKEGVFDGALTIARVTGCEVEAARRAMERLPATVPVALYKQQAQRLVRELSRLQVEAWVVSETPMGAAPGDVVGARRRANQPRNDRPSRTGSGPPRRAGA